MRWRVILSVSNNNSKKWQVTIVTVWISFTVIAFAYFISNKLVDFDIANKLKGIGHQQLAISFFPYLDPVLKDVGNTILHFSQQNCSCQQYSEQHIEDINKIATENEFNVINIVVNEHHLIPATPSIAILNRLGEIIYFGPYGQGFACSQTTGYAQTMLNNAIKGYQANLIITEANGCYCQV